MTGYSYTQAICQHCAYQWVAVFPETTEALECPKCGEYTPLGEIQNALLLVRMNKGALDYE